MRPRDPSVLRPAQQEVMGFTVRTSLLLLAALCTARVAVCVRERLDCASGSVAWGDDCDRCTTLWRRDVTVQPPQPDWPAVGGLALPRTDSDTGCTLSCLKIINRDRHHRISPTLFVWNNDTTVVRISAPPGVPLTYTAQASGHCRRQDQPEGD
ncbi:hypothetical protein ONE63_003358 [Megalurothrips usitatus]|uniref:Uncharacterized protein n=1 Tax=Megalurothrips usitatus TaxID=439358 RepID=A0AAV7XAR7_9NEOP|nr:hypothetical protein ONE63_003358 [Megalurothrips usitatus]